MNYTLSAAAKAAGVAKSTLSKAIHSGDLSKIDQVGNSYRIDPAELDRWMKTRAKRSETVKSEQMETPKETALQVAKEAALRMEIDLLREHLEDMKKQRDSWQTQAERNTRLLEDKSQPKSLFSGLFGRKKSAA